jgi:hypothetical protein
MKGKSSWKFPSTENFSEYHSLIRQGKELVLAMFRGAIIPRVHKSLCIVARTSTLIHSLLNAMRLQNSALQTPLLRTSPETHTTQQFEVAHTFLSLATITFFILTTFPLKHEILKSTVSVLNPATFAPSKKL